MKRGGAGYVQPDSGSFPRLSDMNRFILECGAIPTLTWLNGESEGEQAVEELFAGRRRLAEFLPPECVTRGGVRKHAGGLEFEGLAEIALQ